MKTKLILITIAGATSLMIAACNNTTKENETVTGNEQESTVQYSAGQMAVNDDVSAPNVVKIAVGSKDHTTLVKALQAAELVNALSNNGPFTVFAPVNAAFDALPAGTLDNLLKPESKDALANILYHHVQVAIYKTENFKDGQVLNMFDGTPATFHVKDGKYFIDDASIIASVPATNGIVHVIDKVLLPPAKK
jgi:uncharacterized surface protein with fasciclin (FAS1) repeats